MKESKRQEKQPQEGDLQVWWIPQVPMEAFHYAVKDVEQAKLLLNALAQYDLFQFENKVKPDYCNMGGLEYFNNYEWQEWYDKDGLDINELLRKVV